MLLKHPDQILSYPDLVSKLEEFGISKYESMAYITLLSRGTLGASEVAYYSNLPRTKIYNTLKKLQRKKLVIISGRAPMIATATSPIEAFEEVIMSQEKRLKSMHEILDSLKKLRDEGSKSYEEKKYLILEPNIVVKKIKDLITSATSNIDLMLDSWGQNVVFQCKSELCDVARKGTKVNMLLGIENNTKENVESLPREIVFRSDNISGNILIFDFKKIIFIDSTDGKASLFLNPDPFCTLCTKLFEEKWSKVSE